MKTERQAANERTAAIIQSASLAAADIKGSIFYQIKRVLLKHPFLLVPVVFYLATCAPTIGLGDTAILIDAMLNANMSTHVNNHPMTVIVGWLFSHLPFANIAYRCNLVSVFFGSLAVAGFYLAIYQLFARRLTAVLASTMLMLSYSLWWHSTLVENYATTAFIISLYLNMLVRWQQSRSLKYFYGMFGVTGFGIFNHVQLGFVGLGCLSSLALLMWQQRSAGLKAQVRLFGLCGVAGVVGLTPWLFFLIKDSLALGSLSRGLNEAFFGKFQGIMLHGDPWYGLQVSLSLLFQQSPSPLLILLIAGPFYMFKRWRFSPAALAVLVPCVVNAWFFLTYDTWDRYAFLLLSFIFMFFMAAFAAERFVTWGVERSKRMQGATIVICLLGLAAGPWMYANLADWGNDPNSYWHRRYSNNYTRNTYKVNEYIVNPDKHAYYDVENYIMALFAKLPPNAIYIDDDARAYYPVEFYQRHYKLRPDLKLQIMNSWGFSGWGITPKALHGLFERVLQDNSEIFLISQDFPFRQPLDSFTRRKELKVEPFKLDDSRWIYRVYAAASTK